MFVGCKLWKEVFGRMNWNSMIEDGGGGQWTWGGCKRKGKVARGKVEKKGKAAGEKGLTN